MEHEVVQVDAYPNLALLCWNRDIQYMPREDAFKLYERNWRVLDSLNSALLASTQCFLGGGTRIVLELDEYRESMDVDFLCSNRVGYRTLRNMITQSSFGDLFCADVELMRDIIDLAFMSASWPDAELLTGLARATDAYGDAVRRELAAALTKFADHKYRKQCTTELAVSDPGTLSRGLRMLRKLA